MNSEKEKIAIERLKAFEPEGEPYYLCYSGGKDSDVIRILAELAGVKHEIHHNHTTVDAPETVRYVRSIPGVIIDYPKLTMWELIAQKSTPPTRMIRYCCSELKESKGKGRLMVTGVRWAEGTKRKSRRGLVDIQGKPVTTQKAAQELGAEYTVSPSRAVILTNDNSQSRKLVDRCYKSSSVTVNPVIDWSDEDVWAFLRHYNCASNPLYQRGFHRVGCIGCPLAGYKRMREELEMYPKYKEAYTKAFGRMLDTQRRKGVTPRWESGEAVMRWWLQEEAR